MSTLHNQVHLIGRAGHAVRLVHLSDETPLARLRLYQREPSPSRQFPTQAHALVAWGETARQLHRQVRCGDRLLVQGRLVARQRERQGRPETNWEIHVRHFSVLQRTIAEVTITETCLNEPAPATNPQL